MNYIQRFNKGLIQEWPNAWERKRSPERAGSLPIPKHKHPTVSLTREPSSLHGLEIQPGGGIRREMKSYKSPMTEGRIPELLKLGRTQTDFSALFGGKALPSGKCGRRLLPHARRDVGTTMWGWLQGGDPALWDVALGCTEGRQKGQGSSAKQQREQVSSSWDTRGKSALGSATVTVKSCLGCPAHGCRDAGVGWEPQEPQLSSGLILFWKCLSWGLKQRGLFFLHASVRNSSGFPIQK